jgi:hypothetical protein
MTLLIAISVGGWVGFSLFGIAVSAILLLVVVPRLPSEHRRTAVLAFGIGAAVFCAVSWSAIPFALGVAAIAAAGAGGANSYCRPVRLRKPKGDQNQPVDDRAWSARTSMPGPEASAETLGHTALPAETGPTWAPDELSVWPVEGGRYGVDAHYHGPTGARRAQHQQGRLAAVNLVASVRPNDSGGATLRLGPLQHEAAWLALEAFLGRPISAAI